MGKFAFEDSSWSRYSLTNKNEKGKDVDIMDRVAALETAVKKISGEVDGMFPVGTVLIFADDTITAAKLHDMYGGTWLLYAEGRTLVGAVWNNSSYSSKMKKANTAYDPPGCSYSSGYHFEDSANQKDAGTQYSAIPDSNNDWYAKMGPESLYYHSHTGEEIGDGHFHKAWHRQSYNGETKPNTHYIYQDYDPGSGGETDEAFLQIPTQHKKFNTQMSHTLATDYPEYTNSSAKKVKITTDPTGTPDAKLGTWQPYMTVWFYKRVA